MGRIGELMIGLRFFMSIESSDEVDFFLVVFGYLVWMSRKLIVR